MPHSRPESPPLLAGDDLLLRVRCPGFARTPGVPASVLRAIGNCAQVGDIRRQAEKAREERSDKRPRLIMVATLEAHKDHATLLRAMPEVVRSIPSARLWLAGDGSLRMTLEELAKSLGLADSVHFLGSRRDVPALLVRAACLYSRRQRTRGSGPCLLRRWLRDSPLWPAMCRRAGKSSNAANGVALSRRADPAALAAALVETLSLRFMDSEDRRAHLQQYEPLNMIAAYFASSA